VPVASRLKGYGKHMIHWEIRLRCLNLTRAVEPVSILVTERLGTLVTARQGIF
jgi:hypothetical protein